jgi:hypothetical protein
MTTAELLTDLVVRGVEFQARDDKLRFRSPQPLAAADLENIRRHKAPLLALLRGEGIVYQNRAADLRPIDECDRCGSTDHVDVSIHGGASLRRDCAFCHRFLGWPRWYGRVVLDSDTEDSP